MKRQISQKEVLKINENKIQDSRSQLSTKSLNTCATLKEGNDWDFIFSMPHLQNKSSIEKKLSKILDMEGIFQINLKILLEEYQF